MADSTLHTYELLDSATIIDGARFERGDEIQLTQARGDELEALGSVRPAGADDSDLAAEVEPGADERDLPRLLASASSREKLAAIRMGKRSKTRKSSADSGDGQQARTAPGRAADNVTEAVTGREKPRRA